MYPKGNPSKFNDIRILQQRIYKTTNPLEKITNTRKIAGVMMQNRWLPKFELQKGLDDVVDFYETLKK